jgi:hypothetical protein
MDGLKGSGDVRLVHQELHRPPVGRGIENAKQQLEGRSIPENSKLGLVHQELHRPPTSLRETPGNGPTYGFNPLLELEPRPDPAPGTQAVDDLINRLGQGEGTTAPPPPPPI